MLNCHLGFDQGIMRYVEEQSQNLLLLPWQLGCSAQDGRDSEAASSKAAPQLLTGASSSAPAPYVSITADSSAAKFSSANLASAASRSPAISAFLDSARAAASSQSTLNHQSQMKYSWLKIVPLGQRKVYLASPPSALAEQIWKAWHCASGSAQYPRIK